MNRCVSGRVALPMESVTPADPLLGIRRQATSSVVRISCAIHDARRPQPHSRQ
jgi:hypothetical protein